MITQQYPSSSTLRMTPGLSPSLNSSTIWSRSIGEIAWSAGYVSSRFVAVRYAPGTRAGERIAGSETFRWMFMIDPDARIPKDRDAVRRLRDALLAAGFEPAGRGHAWYAERFQWTRDDPPPERVEVEPSPDDAAANAAMTD